MAYRALAGSELPEQVGTNWPQALHAALSRNELVFALNEVLATPQPLEHLPGLLRERVGRTVTEAEILAWLTLGAAARCDGRPLLRPVVHGFVRGIGGAVVSFPSGSPRPKLWLAAEDEAVLVEEQPGEDEAEHSASNAHFPVATCTTCGQHYYVAHLKGFRFTANRPGGGEAGPAGAWWEPLDATHGGKRVVLVDHLIGTDADEEDDEAQPHVRTASLHFCRHCAAAHPEAVSRCRHCGRGGASVRLHAVRQNAKQPGMLTSCLSCGSISRVVAGRYREPARSVRAINVADVHVLTQDMVHHAERQRLLVFCDNRQDAAFQAGWMKDHARRFRLRALMAEGIRQAPRSVDDLAGHLDDLLEEDATLSLALIPEVWQGIGDEVLGVAGDPRHPAVHRRVAVGHERGIAKSVGGALAVRRGPLRFSLIRRRGRSRGDARRAFDAYGAWPRGGRRPEPFRSRVVAILPRRHTAG